VPQMLHVPPAHVLRGRGHAVGAGCRRATSAARRLKSSSATG
jgi:hypothetical protein